MNKVIIVLAILLLCSCAPLKAYQNDVVIDKGIPTQGFEKINNWLYRAIDKEAGVVCWVYAYSERGGIDCMPTSDTRLD